MLALLRTIRQILLNIVIDRLFILLLIFQT